MAAAYGLETTQVDYTAAFVQAEPEKPPTWRTMTPKQQKEWGVYVEMPCGFIKAGHVMKLKKNLYGRSSAPRQWFLLLKKKLHNVGLMQQTNIDPCLFLSDKVIMVLFVDDSLLFAHKKRDIEEIISKLRQQENLTLDEEDTTNGFLGVKIDRSIPGTVTLSQPGLTDRIIKDLHLDDIPGAHTPATGILGTDPEGEPPIGTFNYASVVGAMWYLACHSRPDIQLALSQAARFTFNTKRSHELALIQIGRYLKQTRTKGLTFSPADMSNLQLDCHVDSDFLGRYGHDDRTDPTNVKSRMGYVILVNKCPIVWGSSLMNDVCMSTMMAEYYRNKTKARNTDLDS